MVESKNFLKYLFFSLRIPHWIKNLFIFLPLIFGQKLFDLPTSLKTMIAFFLFSLTASAGYLINDIVDSENDTFHPTKRLRPIPSGKIGLTKVKIVACVLGGVSLILSYLLNISFGFVVTTYLAFSIIYTKILKEVVIIDVFCIGFFFLLRIIAGGIVAEIELSHWIILMTGLLALFLGFNKRRQELRLLGKEAISHRGVLAKYNAYFIDQMIAVITSSIVVAYMLYTVDARTLALFGSRKIMLSIPFVYYGIFRYLYLIHKLHKDGDPTRIFFFDKNMQLNLALWVIVCIGVIYFR